MGIHMDANDIEATPVATRVAFASIFAPIVFPILYPVAMVWLIFNARYITRFKKYNMKDRAVQEEAFTRNPDNFFQAPENEPRYTYWDVVRALAECAFWC